MSRCTSRLPYDPVKDFVADRALRQDSVRAGRCNPSLPVQLDSAISSSYAKAQKLAYASTGTGRRLAHHGRRAAQEHDRHRDDRMSPIGAVTQIHRPDVVAGHVQLAFATAQLGGGRDQGRPRARARRVDAAPACRCRHGRASRFAGSVARRDPRRLAEAADAPRRRATLDRRWSSVAANGPSLRADHRRSPRAFVARARTRRAPGPIAQRHRRRSTSAGRNHRRRRSQLLGPASCATAADRGLALPHCHHQSRPRPTRAVHD